MNSSYITSAAKPEQLPDLGGHPEIAFVGRSNVGKSSLLNALLSRTNLARMSKTPGRTQMVNFFAVDRGETRLILADLPGYGYAATGREVKQHWQGLVEAYLGRRELAGIFFLIDTRRAPELDAEDEALLVGLSFRKPAVPVVVVLTKTDKATQKELAAATAEVKARLKAKGAKVDSIVPVSSLKKKGLDTLQEMVLGYFAD